MFLALTSSSPRVFASSRLNKLEQELADAAEELRYELD
jgi:hypothetical protein